MTKAKKTILGFAAMALIVMAGCEWSTPSSDETWTMNGYDWFDFSGTYHGASGGPIVTGFTYEDPTTSGIVNGEVISSGTGSLPGTTTLSPAYNSLGDSTTEWQVSGRLQDNVVAGSVSIDLAGAGSVVDNGAGDFILSSGNFALDGSIYYDSGAVLLTLGPISGGTVFPDGGIATASYQYGGTAAFSGNFAHGSVTPGSVTIIAGDHVFTEYFPTSADYTRAITEGMATLRTADDKVGTISYATGAWSIDLGSVSISGDVTASYEYTINAPFEPGNTGTPIVTLSISQVGNKLTIIDSTGRTFNGTIGVANGSGGNIRPTDEDDYSTQIMAQFTAYHSDIEIVGTLTGLYSSEEPGVLFDRTIQAVWIEPTVQGDVHGTSVRIYVPEFLTAPVVP